MLDNNDMDFLGKSGSAKDDIKSLPDLFNGVRHLQCKCKRNLLNNNSDDINKDQCSDNLLDSGDDDKHIPCKNDIEFLSSGDHISSNESINIVTIKDDSLHKCENLGSGEHIQNDIDNHKTVNDDNDSPYERNFLGSGDSTMVQAVVPMKGLDVCNPVSFVREMLCNLCDFIVNGWPNSKTDVPVPKLCHWFLQDELGYYNGVIMKGSSWYVLADTEFSGNEQAY